MEKIDFKNAIFEEDVIFSDTALAGFTLDEITKDSLNMTKA